MSPIVVGVIGIIVVLILLFLGFPVGLGMMLVGIVGFSILVNPDAAIHIAGVVPYELISKFDWLVLPLFLIMGSVFFFADLGKSLFRFAYTLIGHLPGGLAMAAIGACGLFAAISSSSIVTAVTIGSTAIPEMKAYGYKKAFACGCLAAGGTLGILIPPSGIFIIYGIITQTSIVKLFLAGIIPGVILTLLFIIMIYIWARIQPDLAPPGAKSTVREKFTAAGDCIEVVALIVLVLGGLWAGWFTPTEAGGIGAFGAIIVSQVRRRLNWERFKLALADTVRTTGMIFLCLIGALILNAFIAISTIPMELAGLVNGFGLPPMIVMFLIVVVYIILGCFVDTMSMVLLTVPVFFPLVTNTLGYDAIAFGVIIVLVTEMAMITPPVGMNVWIISGIAKDVPMEDIFKSIMPFVLVEFAFVILLIVFPGIATFLPKL